MNLQNVDESHCFKMRRACDYAAVVSIQIAIETFLIFYR